MNEDKSTEYTVMLTEKEIQCMANAMRAFFNWLGQEKKSPPIEQAQAIMSALHKMKTVLDLNKSQILVPK